MKDLSSELIITRKQPVYRQIESRIKQAITVGELPCGSRLPTDRALATQYGTSVFTIQKALEPLVKAGLIERTRRRGTYVVSRSNQLQHVGIYFGGDFLNSRGMSFCREVNRQLADKLEGRLVKHSLWIDGRPRRAQGEPLPELVDGISKGSVQGLIVGVSHPAEMRWLTKLGIPLAICGTAPVPYRVGFDNDRMTDLVIQEFKQQGCRSIGVIFQVSSSFHEPTETKVPEDIRNFFQRFVDRVADAQLETRNSWIRIPDRRIFSSEHEDYGYRQFQEIWGQSSRPDGLLVYPDTVVRGCLLAMLECGVSAPADIKLILHRNKGIPVLCPMPASWLVADPGLVAVALIRHIDRQLAGQPVEPFFVPHTLETSEGSRARLSLSSPNNKAPFSDPR